MTLNVPFQMNCRTFFDNCTAWMVWEENVTCLVTEKRIVDAPYFNHRTPLITINGNVNAKRYIDEVLRPSVVPSMANPCAQFARLQTAFINNNHVPHYHDQPVRRNVSPIEHLWNQIKQAVRGRKPPPVTNVRCANL